MYELYTMNKLLQSIISAARYHTTVEHECENVTTFDVEPKKKALVGDPRVISI